MKSKKQWLENGRKIVVMLLVCMLAFGMLAACEERQPEETVNPAQTTEKTPETSTDETGDPEETTGNEPEDSTGAPQTATEEEPERYYVPTVSGDSENRWSENSLEQYMRGILYRRAEFDDNGNLTKKIQYDIDDDNGDGSTDDVITWIEYRYEYDEAGRVIKETQYSEDGRSQDWKEFTYDADGYLIREEKYRSEGRRAYVREYRTDGQELKYTKYRDGYADFSISYTYDSDGHLLSERRSGAGWADYNRVYEYNEDGKLIRYTYYNGTNRVELSETYEYSAGKRRTETIRYDNAGTATVTSGEAEYDAAGQRIKSTYYEKDGSLGGWYEYEYDDAGNNTKETQYTSDGSVSHVWSCEYMEVTAAQYKALQAIEAFD